MFLLSFLKVITCQNLSSVEVAYLKENLNHPTVQVLSLREQFNCRGVLFERAIYTNFVNRLLLIWLYDFKA